MLGSSAQNTNTFPGSGNAGIGTTTPGAFLHILGPGTTYDQLWLGNDADYYAKFNMSATGALTISPVVPTGVTASTTITGHLLTGTYASNLFIANAGGAQNTNYWGYQFAGSTNTYFRTAIGGATSTGLTTGRNYSGLNVESSPITLGSSVNIPFAASAVVNPIANITLGTGSSVTNTATLYIDGANTQGTNNYALYSSGGLNYFGGNIAVNTLIMPAGYQFAVNGSMIATAVTVKLYSNWPDYVFKKGYRLASLGDIKTYIDHNHHLPDMPSEEQIAKDGLNLGEINKLLVKKVEELTLYMIEKDNQINEQDKMINAQQTKLSTQQAEIDKLGQQLEELAKKLAAAN